MDLSPICQWPTVKHQACHQIHIVYTEQVPPTLLSKMCGFNLAALAVIYWLSSQSSLCLQPLMQMSQSLLPPSDPFYPLRVFSCKECVQSNVRFLKFNLPHPTHSFPPRKIKQTFL